MEGRNVYLLTTFLLSCFMGMNTFEDTSNLLQSGTIGIDLYIGEQIFSTLLSALAFNGVILSLYSLYIESSQCKQTSLLFLNTHIILVIFGSVVYNIVEVFELLYWGTEYDAEGPEYALTGEKQRLLMGFLIAIFVVVNLLVLPIYFILQSSFVKELFISINT